MPRYAYQKPRAKVYAYNFGYMNNYYKPMTHFLSKDSPSPLDRPGAQSLAERLKKFPMDGSMYPDKDVRYLPSARPPLEIVRTVAPAAPVTEPEALLPKNMRYLPSAQVPRVIERTVSPAVSVTEPEALKPVVEAPKQEEMKVAPLYLKHPYHLPVESEKRRAIFDPIWFRNPWDWECIWVPPHGNCTTPHFGVEACHNLITRWKKFHIGRWKKIHGYAHCGLCIPTASPSKMS